jgi:hypothetical protein
MLINARQRQSEGFYKFNRAAFGVAAIGCAAVSLASPFFSDARPLGERLEFSGIFLLGAGAFGFASKVCAALAQEVRDTGISEEQGG